MRRWRSRWAVAVVRDLGGRAFGAVRDARRALGSWRRRWFRAPEACAIAGLALVAVSLWGYDPRIAGLVVGLALVALGLGLARTTEDVEE